MNQKNIFDTDKIGSLLLKLTAPAFMGMVVITLYNVVDTIFIGHYVGHLAIAGLSIVFPIQMFSMGVGQMMGMGGASLISRFHGRGQTGEAEKVLGNSITATVIFSAIIMITGLSNIDYFLTLIGASPDVLPYARDYLQIILIGMFFQTFAMTMNFLIRSEGNSRVPMKGMMIGAVVNIALDAVFIIPLDMGVQGAALATIIAQIVSVAYFAYYYMSGASYFKILVKNLKIQWRVLWSIISIGFASLARMTANSFTIILINIALGTYGGDLAISAYGIVNRIAMFALMPGIVIGQGMQPILGYNYGAGRYDRALRVIKLSIISATAFGIASFAVLYFLPDLFIRIFTSDAGVIDLGIHAAKQVFFVIYIVGFIMVGSTAFQALGNVWRSIISSMARSVFFLIPAILILPQFWHLDGIWLAFPITDVLTFLLTMAMFIPQVVMLVKARRKQIAEGEHSLPG
ncbi:MAG: MATE family efflux transporter [Dehalococcoidales bacterium]|jgi:putative MATE family efflux protein|nr:MATE family efflux transporter [Dehalococcoidales bacterium]